MGLIRQIEYFGGHMITNDSSAPVAYRSISPLYSSPFSSPFNSYWNSFLNNLKIIKINIDVIVSVYA